MKENMGKIDKYLRLVIGIVAITLGIYFQSWWGAIGIIPLFTSFVGWCPAYAPFGFSTISKNNNSQRSIK